MTYNPLLVTPSPNNIQSLETISGPYFSSTGDTNIVGSTITTKTGSFGNSVTDSTTINSTAINSNNNIDLRTSVINFVASSANSDISFNTNAIFIDASTVGATVGFFGIGTNTPQTDLHIIGSVKTTDGASFFNDTFLVNTGSSAANRLSILGTTSITFFVGGNSNFIGLDNNIANSFVEIDTVNTRIGINSYSAPLTRLHVGSAGLLSISGKKVDSSVNILLEKSDSSFLQIISPNTDFRNCNGILFSSFANGTTSKGVRHFSMYANWGDGTSDPSNAAITVSDLGFAYLSSSLVTDPFRNSVANKTFAWFSNSVSFADIYFTGQHFCKPSEMELDFYKDKIGLIVICDGTYCETLDPSDPEETTISINESLPKVKLASKRNDKTVFGVISDKEDEESQRVYSSGMYYSTYEKRSGDHRLIINSVGEGAIWICNINGNLENGDYITSCEIPGYGMKQDTDLLMNYTVAKITCDCDFDLSSSIYKCEEFEFSGSIYRRAFVGCTYHCG